MTSRNGVSGAIRPDSPVTEAGSLADVPGAHQPLAEGRGAGEYVTRLTA